MQYFMQCVLGSNENIYVDFTDIQNLLNYNVKCSVFYRTHM